MNQYEIIAEMSKNIRQCPKNKCHACVESLDLIDNQVEELREIENPAIDPESPKVVMMDYVNYKHEQSFRNIIPISIAFKATKWHKTQQWILKAFDLDKGAEREFAMVDIVDWEIPRSKNEIQA